MEAKASKHASKREHACARACVCVCVRVRVRARWWEGGYMTLTVRALGLGHTGGVKHRP